MGMRELREAATVTGGGWTTEAAGVGPGPGPKDPVGGG